MHWFEISLFHCGGHQQQRPPISNATIPQRNYGLLQNGYATRIFDNT
jgi:hypothetical protein